MTDYQRGNLMMQAACIDEVIESSKEPKIQQHLSEIKANILKILPKPKTNKDET